MHIEKLMSEGKLQGVVRINGPLHVLFKVGFLCWARFFAALKLGKIVEAGTQFKEDKPIMFAIEKQLERVLELHDRVAKGLLSVEAWDYLDTLTEMQIEKLAAIDVNSIIEGAETPEEEAFSLARDEHFVGWLAQACVGNNDALAVCEYVSDVVTMAMHQNAQTSGNVDQLKAAHKLALPMYLKHGSTYKYAGSMVRQNITDQLLPVAVRKIALGRSIAKYRSKGQITKTGKRFFRLYEGHYLALDCHHESLNGAVAATGVVGVDEMAKSWTGLLVTQTAKSERTSVPMSLRTRNKLFRPDNKSTVDMLEHIIDLRNEGTILSGDIPDTDMSLRTDKIARDLLAIQIARYQTGSRPTSKQAAEDQDVLPDADLQQKLDIRSLLAVWSRKGLAGARDAVVQDFLIRGKIVRVVWSHVNKEEAQAKKELFERQAAASAAAGDQATDVQAAAASAAAQGERSEGGGGAHTSSTTPATPPRLPPPVGSVARPPLSAAKRYRESPGLAGRSPQAHVQARDDLRGAMSSAAAHSQTLHMHTSPAHAHVPPRPVVADVDVSVASGRIRRSLDYMALSRGQDQPGGGAR